MSLRILIANAQLELVPPEICGHPSIRRMSQFLGKKGATFILDQNQHRPAMKGIEDEAIRGRPDLLHYTLLNILEGPMAREGRVEVAVHTREGHFLRFRKDTRLPRGESRFHGVMSRVLRLGASQDKDPLVWVESTCGAKKALESFAKGPVIRLDAGGKALDPMTLAKQSNHGELTIVIGGFAHGGFPQEWIDLVPTTASLYGEELNAWTVAAEVVAGYRAYHDA